MVKKHTGEIIQSFITTTPEHAMLIEKLAVKNKTTNDHIISLLVNKMLVDNKDYLLKELE